MDEEETLTSEVTDRGVGDMKKVNSMEKLGKLRGQMSVVSLNNNLRYLKLLSINLLELSIL